MTKKDEDLIRIKRSTFMILIILAVAVILAAGGLYYYNFNKAKSNIKTKEIGSIETIDAIVTAIVAKECKICLNMTELVDELKMSPFVNVKQSNILFASSRNAKDFIAKYEITKLPTLIIQGDTDKLPLKGFRSVEDGAVLEDIPPPYVDLENKDIAGLVDIIYLTDDSCEDCYDVKQHRDIMLFAFGLYLANENTIDISSKEGKALLDKYEITNVPTILLSEEAAIYPTIDMVWDQLGTIEEDGRLVFRNFEMTNDLIFKDIDTGEIINSSSLNEN